MSLSVTFSIKEVQEKSLILIRTLPLNKNLRFTAVLKRSDKLVKLILCRHYQIETSTSIYQYLCVGQSWKVMTKHKINFLTVIL